MRRVVKRGTLAAMMVAAAPSVAVAADEATTEREAQARFEEGIARVKAGNLEAARMSFTQAYALLAKPTILWNLALTDEKTGHLLEALDHFREFAHGSTSGDDRSNAGKHITTLMGQTVHLEVAAPAGAQVVVDGNAAGTAPLADVVDVMPGMHRIEARTAVGPRTADVEGTAGQLVHVSLLPPPSGPPVAVVTPLEPRDAVGPPSLPPPDVDTGEAATGPSTMRITAVALLGTAAAASVGLGAYFAIQSQSREHTVAGYGNTYGGSYCHQPSAANAGVCGQWNDAVQAQGLDATLSDVLYVGGRAGGRGIGDLAVLAERGEDSRAGARARRRKGPRGHRSSRELLREHEEGFLMLARMPPWALPTAGSLVTAVFAYACAVNTSGTCQENGTCTPDADASLDGDVVTDATMAMETGEVTEASVEAGTDAGAGDADAGVDAFVDASGGAGEAGDAADASDAPTCNPALSPSQDRCVLDDRFGVFVTTTGNDNNLGTMEAPLATIGVGLQVAAMTNRSRVYVCDGMYAEAVSVSSAVSIYGGLACPGDAGWTYAEGGVAQVISPPGTSKVPLTIAVASGPIAIEDMRLAAANATDQDDAGNGQSSIAVVVKGSTVAFRRCVLIAGNGAPGDDGVILTNYAGMGPAPTGQPNDGGGGGAGGAITCTDGTSSTGGAGGSALATGGQDGGAHPMPVTSPGLDGVGAAGGAASCAGGDPGAIGAPGGPVAMVASLGAWTDAGWAPASGAAGANGSPGQGGGGGGGKSLAVTGGTGGGAGGCGGAGGTGGAGGGASIALACIGSAVTLTDCVLTATNGGNGGKGATVSPARAEGLRALRLALERAQAAMAEAARAGEGAMAGREGFPCVSSTKGPPPTEAPGRAPTALPACRVRRDAEGTEATTCRRRAIQGLQGSMAPTARPAWPRPS